MSNNKDQSVKQSAEDITKENFVWRTKDKEVTLDEMDIDFKLAALIHSFKLSNTHSEKYHHHQKQAEYHTRQCEYHTNRTAYFVQLADIIEVSLIEDDGLPDIPTTIEDIKAMRRLIKSGVVTLTNKSN